MQNEKNKGINKGMELDVPDKEHHSEEGSCDQPLDVFQIQFAFDPRWLPLIYPCNASFTFLLLLQLLFCVEELTEAWLLKNDAGQDI